MSQEPKYWLKAKTIVFTMITTFSGVLFGASTEIGNIVKVYLPKVNPIEIDAWAALARNVGMGGLLGGGSLAVRSRFTDTDPIYTDKFLPGPNREDFGDRPPSV